MGMNARVEAAAKVIYRTSGRKQVMQYEEAGQICEMEASEVLAAADAVMFDEAAVERAAEALYDVRRNDPSARLITKTWAELDEECKPFYRIDARAVIAALKGDAHGDD